jgi:putative toxin-antitoxin system antitoxin component (TIGR02293 family)
MSTHKSSTPAKRSATALQEQSFINIFRASPIERVAMIKRGISAADAKSLFSTLDVEQNTGFAVLNLSPATVNKKAKQGASLSPEESERVIGLAKLVGQVQAMVQDSGDPTGFDAPAWLKRWLSEPLPALGFIRPADLMDTMEGQTLVSSTLAQLQSGAYA